MNRQQMQTMFAALLPPDKFFIDLTLALQAGGVVEKDTGLEYTDVFWEQMTDDDLAEVLDVRKAEVTLQ